MNDDDKEKKQDENFIPLYKTLAILDDAEKYKITNVTKPSEQDVEDARDWVKENEL